MAVGCGAHQARIVDRDGAVVAEADVLVQVEWSRILDDVSGATVTIAPTGDCCRALGRVRSWRHQLMVWRNGRPVWEGPLITPLRWTAAGAQLTAGDVTAWLDRRVPHRNIRFSGADLATIAEWLIEDGFRPDDPGHTTQIIGPSRIRGDREYKVDVGQTGDHLRDLARNGIDYTAVGSRILILPEDHCARVGSLSDDHFPGGLEVVEDGAALATRWVLWGDEDDNGNQVKGEAGGRHPYYHLLERVAEEPSILDTPSAVAAARSRLRASSPAPVFIDSQSATLSPDAPVDVGSLVPGWCIDVTSTATCRPIQQTMKLTGVAVSEDNSGETVRVVLAPAGVGSP